MYYIRMLSKPSALDKLANVSNIEELCADFLAQEMKTSSNTLSFWHSESLEKEPLDRAIIAALLASNKIETTQFIIIDSDSLNANDIQVDDYEPGKTAYIGGENLHSNLCDLNYKKIGSILQIYKSICMDEKLTPKIQKSQVKEYIKDAKMKNLINEEKAQDDLKPKLKKLLESVQSLAI